MADNATLIIPKLKLGDVLIDCTVTQRHTAASDITDHPVEDGAPVTDHSRPQPRRLSLQGIIAGSALVTSGLSGTVDEPARLSPGQAFEELVRLKDTATELTVVTALVTYRNMLIESIVTTRDVNSGDSLRFDAELKQVRKAKTVERNIPGKKKGKTKPINPATPRGEGMQETGPKVKPPAPVQNVGKAMRDQANSWLVSLVDTDENTSEVPRGIQNQEAE